MKIGILTQPLSFNYGGLLQAYALQKTLKDCGHEVWIINRYYNYNAIYRLMSAIKNSLLSFLRCMTEKKKYRDAYYQSKYAFLTSLRFKKAYIKPCSKCLTSDDELKHFVRKHNFDAYVVGSDQVWRPKYAPNIYSYFLDFAKDDKVIRMAYAASFGTDVWEFTPQETKTCKDLLKLFDYVSTRESNGVTLCRKYLGRDDAIAVLDPTLLLHKADYERIIDQVTLPSTESPFIVSYILDVTDAKRNLLETIKTITGKDIYDAGKGIKWHKDTHTDRRATVEEWLYGFRHADFSIIDSFHGCVFSIIFHVPFVVIGNKERGMSRFNSLLSLLNLEERLMDENATVNDIMALKAIDWCKVDDILSKQREFSLAFLSKLN